MPFHDEYGDSPEGERAVERRRSSNAQSSGLENERRMSRGLNGRRNMGRNGIEEGEVKEGEERLINPWISWSRTSCRVESAQTQAARKEWKGGHCPMLIGKSRERGGSYPPPHANFHKLELVLHLPTSVLDTGR